MSLRHPTPPHRLAARHPTLRVLAAMFTALAVAALAGWGSVQSDAPSASPAGRAMSSLAGATAWVNSPPLDAGTLKGRVVLVDFWTYSCINCLRTLPYVRAWAQKYAPFGLVVVGAHTPEFDFEHAAGNVEQAVKRLGIGYPVAVDSNRKLWAAFETYAWPTLYFVDASGRIRGRQLGEGRYDDAERMIQQLLREAGRSNVPTDLVAPAGRGTQAAAGPLPSRSDETYLGASKAEGFVSAAGVLQAGRATLFAPATRLRLNQWTLAGHWNVGAEKVEVRQAGGRIAYRFHARDLHLVLGLGKNEAPIRFKVSVDGHAPGASHGSDVDAQGWGRIDSQRLYQLVRQPDAISDRLFEIEFLEPGARAYSFTFG